VAKKKTSFVKKVLIIFSIIVLGGGAIMAYQFYSMIYKPNVYLGTKKNKYIYIKSNANFNDVMNELRDKNILLNYASFDRLAEMKEYKNNIKPGKYLVEKDMNNNKLINILKASLSEKVKVNLSNLRTKQQLAGRVGSQLEADSTTLMQLLNDDKFLDEYGFTSENSLALFIPGDYKLDWNTPSEKFVEIMAEEYKKFWTEGRKQKAKEIGLTQTEVAVLASIIQQEQQSKLEERPMIAGVYMNRLKQNMLLQADPTVVFAVGDFNINRVLNVHKDIDSPYNTYKYEGLPPGPICIASPNAIDAVLNYTKTDCMFFCAREDFSGYHNFAKTYQKHVEFANKYRKELDKRGISK
jgi:UPF0755 protein